MLDIESLLQPGTAQAPAGPNLEHSPAFAQLERLAVGKPERQVGELITPGEPPDWGAVVTASTALLKESKDLRVALHLTRSLLEVHGFAGLADGLSLVRQLVVRYWPALHPELDADDDNDPTSRINAMTALTHRDMVSALRAAPLLRSKAFGPVSLRDVDGGQGRPAGAGAETGAPVESVFQSTPLPDLAAAANDAERCALEAKSLEEEWTTRLAVGGPDFADLRRVLAKASDLMKARLVARTGANGGADPAQASSFEAGPGGGATVSSVGGDPRSRDDVVRALDAICSYYARNEPSSPVPLLLERCKRLVTMSFLDIVRDMVPEGLPALQTIAGKRND